MAHRFSILILAFVVTVTLPGLVAAGPPTQCKSCHSNLNYLLTEAQAVIAAGQAPADYHDVVFTAEKLANGWYTSDAFFATNHGKKDCTFCHQGNGQATDKNLAHGGDFLKDPTAGGGKLAGIVCAGCHKDQSEHFDTALMFIKSGTRNKLDQRLTGQPCTVNGQTLDAVDIRDVAFANDCTDCHATCGTCHVNRPYVDGGGLLNNHVFAGNKKVEIDCLETCIPCHHLAGDHFYTEQLNLHVRPGIDFDCIDCHSASQEMHGRGGPLGDGSEEQHMMDGVILAKCEGCHPRDAASAVHRDHLDDSGLKVACVSCHGTNYESCTNCHGRVEDMTMLFKMGNLVGTVYPFAQTGAAPAMFDNYGITLDGVKLDAAKGKWAPYIPHFLEREPLRKAGATFSCENCHGNPDAFLNLSDEHNDNDLPVMMQPPPAL